MKRFLCLSVAVVVGVVTGRLLVDVNVHAQANAPLATANGDVNCDGSIVIADAVYLLNWLFLGGPMPCKGPVAPEDPLPDPLCTGQTTCYDQDGNIVDCESDICPGQDGFYRPGPCTRDARFVDNGDGTVTDTFTGLTWQQVAADMNDNQQIDPPDLVSWCEALTYCENLVLAGDDDWRLPNIRELQSIVDYGRDPVLDPIFGTVPAAHWSSTTVSAADRVGRAWGLGLRGAVSPTEKSSTRLVRAVRGGL